MAHFEFKLRFPLSDITRFAADYSYIDEDKIPVSFVSNVRKRGFLTREEFLQVCRWKTPRSKPLVEKNTAEVISIITRAAFRVRDDEVKIGLLQVLKGVSFPTASVFLHFYDQAPYPILDFRALWSLGYDKPPAYDFRFWIDYTRFIRSLCKKSGQSMRTVDRALWQYSKTNQ